MKIFYFGLFCLGLALISCINDPVHTGKTIVIDCNGYPDSTLYADSNDTYYQHKTCNVLK